MNKKFKEKFIAGGCSFTFGNELSDDVGGKTPSKKSWAYILSQELNLCQPDNYVCTARPGAGNTGIARRVFNAVGNLDDITGVAVMWSFLSRYDWAMPRHKSLEDTRLTTLTPWDTTTSQAEVFRELAGAEHQQEEWKRKRELLKETGVHEFADSLYKNAANQYHEIYLSWKSIIWLQNILEKKKIPFIFTLADNSLFYDKMTLHSEKDTFLKALYKEIDFTKWFFFGERCMGFNQWATLNDYEKGTTHPLDKAHQDAVQLITPTFEKIKGGK